MLRDEIARHDVRHYFHGRASFRNLLDQVAPAMRSWARRQASGVASDIPERSTLWRMQLYLKPCLAVLGWVIGMRRTERTRERLQNSGVKRIAHPGGLEGRRPPLLNVEPQRAQAALKPRRQSATSVAQRAHQLPKWDGEGIVLGYRRAAARFTISRCNRRVPPLPPVSARTAMSPLRT